MTPEDIQAAYDRGFAAGMVVGEDNLINELRGVDLSGHLTGLSFQTYCAFSAWFKALPRSMRPVPLATLASTQKMTA